MTNLAAVVTLDMIEFMCVLSSVMMMIQDSGEDFCLRDKQFSVWCITNLDERSPCVSFVSTHKPTRHPATKSLRANNISCFVFRDQLCEQSLLAGYTHSQDPPPPPQKK